ncbi:MAG: chloride channel protein, partial [Inconstantimicrobium porci]|uniref:chloride channel protein n=1 Tax=Inconstantimicrobium porci TaxID=2652291 RepID=UPI002A91BA9E
KVIILGVLCAVISILFCESLHKTNKFLADHVKNNYIKVIIGGVLVVALTFLCGSRDYNGAGVEVIAKAINGQAIPYAFLLKILFTTLTISFGYKGGEIVPTFFIGATFGCTAAGILGLDPGFGAAIGVAALFCGVTNSLITSIVLSIELFGSQGLVLFALACGVSYMLSGYYSLYGTQKIVYSKLRAEYVNRNAK